MLRMQYVYFTVTTRDTLHHKMSRLMPCLCGVPSAHPSSTRVAVSRVAYPVDDEVRVVFLAPYFFSPFAPSPLMMRLQLFFLHNIFSLHSLRVSCHAEISLRPKSESVLFDNLNNSNVIFFLSVYLQ